MTLFVNRKSIFRDHSFDFVNTKNRCIKVVKIIALSFYFILPLICSFLSWAVKLSRIENFKIRKGLISPFFKSSVPKRTRKQKSIFIITNFLKRWKKRNGDNFLEINVASCFINQISEFLFLQEKVVLAS